jgi:hypothetical protein
MTDPEVPGGFAGGIAQDPPAARTYHLLRCHDCGDPARTFTTPEQRDDWRDRHTQATGHQRWLVKDVTLA